ncbi:MAG: DDE-type integrase/transposase/recombinase [Ilumatobacter sp.]|uniref:DDE-type integrase/transposase/recombinase n=1 Tax=Ilumatobacter sp. TaxID=1967498 RepID=UPI003298628B
MADRHHRALDPQGGLYLCAIKDVWSNRIIGSSIDSHMTARLAVNAIDNAVARRGGDVAGCILLSDRNSQFRSRKAQQALTRHGMVGSMGQVGSAGDNAAMESFFSRLQKNVLNRRTGTTRDELRIEIVTWIERTYQRRRRQPRLGRLTPIEYETITTPTTPAAQQTPPVTGWCSRPFRFRKSFVIRPSSSPSRGNSGPAGT